ncbi:MAG: response regulator transcription factor [Treponema sp.]|jgi:DNA-binding response OmpR family regulator|nr:response regulator transcription factor [Treponema sp.]
MKEKPVVLVVDDEEKILELVKSYLEINGYRGICAKTGKEGLDYFQNNHVDLLLLDLMLPDVSGEDLCRTVRSVSDIPVIMITARADEESVIHGLAIGADDYVCKPFSPRQLMARVKTALRRTDGGLDGKRFVSGDLLVDTGNRRISRGGKELPLTSHEYRILALLMSRPMKIFTRDEIIEYTKGEDYDGFDRAVDTHIKKIRRKIGDDPKSPRYIMTVYGMGYRFADGGEGPV